VEKDVTGEALSDDLIRKFGFTYMIVKNKPALICHGCAKKFKDLQDELKDYVNKAECEFFDTCGEEKEYGRANNGGTKNERK
jgi:hypothetical protein